VTRENNQTLLAIIGDLEVMKETLLDNLEYEKVGPQEIYEAGTEVASLTAAIEALTYITRY